MRRTPAFVDLRFARESDLEPLFLLIRDTIEFSYRGVYPDSAVEFFKRYHSGERIYERIQNGVVLVLEKQGRLVATGSLVGNEILGVFVAGDHQGRGFGKKIMFVLESHAKLRGLRSVTLSVSLPSEGFYRKLGYEILKPRSIEMPDGERLDYWEAWKIIP